MSHTNINTAGNDTTAVVAARIEELSSVTVRRIQQVGADQFAVIYQEAEDLSLVVVTVDGNLDGKWHLRCKEMDGANAEFDKIVASRKAGTAVGEITEEQVKKWFADKIVEIQALAGGKYVSLNFAVTKVPGHAPSADWHVYSNLVASVNGHGRGLDAVLAEFASKIESPSLLRAQAAQLLVDAEAMERGAK